MKTWPIGADYSFRAHVSAVTAITRAGDVPQNRQYGVREKRRLKLSGEELCRP